MRVSSTALLSFSFVIALAGGAAAQPAPDPDAPISTGPAEILVPAASPLAPMPVVASGPLNLAESRAEVIQETLQAVADPRADRIASAVMAEADELGRPGEVVQLNTSTSIIARRNPAGEQTGGFLRANPQFEKRDRRTVGLAMRF